jgi:hypothetical protein
MLREQGIRSLWFAILERRRIYRRLVCIERILSEPIPEIKANLPIGVGFLQESEVSDYVNFRPGASASETRRKLNDGDRCIVARYEGQIVSAFWASIRRASLVNVGEYLDRDVSLELPLAQDEVFLYDAYTLPQFRGQNVSPESSVWNLRYWREAGYRRVFVGVSPENKSSLRACKKEGYRPFAVIGYFKLGPLRWDFLHHLGSDERGLPVSSMRVNYERGLGESNSHEQVAEKGD